MEPPFRRHSSRSYRIHLRRQVSLLSRLFYGAYARQILLQFMTKAPTTRFRPNQALQPGGKDNGAPGLYPHYHANYYAAFVIGPDGHNIEVVCHEPEA